MSHGIDISGLPGELFNTPREERRLHRQLVLRHIDFLLPLLVADQELHHWMPMSGCPAATPESLARKRRNGDTDMYPCLYTTVYRYNNSSRSPVASDYDLACLCGDPLVNSDDPLDAVAAVALASDNRSVADRYVDRRWRAVIAGLRSQYGTWKEIERLTEQELIEGVEDVRGSPVSEARVGRLHTLLKMLAGSDQFDEITLQNIKRRPYYKIHELFTRFPGISSSDGWWLLLTALDKPVWPADPDIDRLLCDLGLLAPQDVATGERHEELEEALVDRLVPALHRALAGHAARGQKHFAIDGCELRKFSLTYRAREQFKSNDRHDRPVVVDLFAGAGGISHGFLRAGYDVTFAVDNDQYATDTYRLNHPQISHERVLCEDIEDLFERNERTKLSPQRPDIVVGGPPCQSLSQAGYRTRRADDETYNIRDDPRTSLYTRYLDAVSELRPKALIVENVEGMANKIGDTDERIVDQLIEDLESGDAGGGPAYMADFRTIDCSEYGIPQNRNRIIVFGVREDLARDGHSPGSFFEKLSEHQLEEPSDRGPVTLNQGLAGLPRLRWNEGGDIVLGKPRGTPSHYVDNHDLAADTELSFNHRAREHPMEKDRTIFEIMDPGDTGWEVKFKKDGGKWGHLIEYNVGTEDNPSFTDKYRMIHWDEPAPTVVAHLAKDANNYVIPDYYKYANIIESRQDPARNRGITPREAARIQSFPDDYIFLGPYINQFRQVGNAVPPVLAWHIAMTLQETVLDQATMTVEGIWDDSRKPISSDD